jgi:hypothetical protein
LKYCEQRGADVVEVSDSIVKVAPPLDMLGLEGYVLVVLDVATETVSGAVKVTSAVGGARPFDTRIDIPNVKEVVWVGLKAACIVDHAAVVLYSHGCEEDKHEDHEDAHICKVGQRLHQRYEQMLDFREHVYDLHWAEDYPHHPKGGV